MVKQNEVSRVKAMIKGCDNAINAVMLVVSGKVKHEYMNEIYEAKEHLKKALDLLPKI